MKRKYEIVCVSECGFQSRKTARAADTLFIDLFEDYEALKPLKTDKSINKLKTVN